MMDTMTGVRKPRDQFIVRGPEREESPLRLQLSMRFKRLAKHPLGSPIYADELRLEGRPRYSRCQYDLLSAFSPRTRGASSKAWEGGVGAAPHPKSDHCRPPPFYRLGGPFGTLSASCN